MFVKRLQRELLGLVIAEFYCSPLNCKAMFIRNLVRYRRMMMILVGLIIINIITRFMIDSHSHDNFPLVAYILVSIIWVDFIRVNTEFFVQMVDRWIREENGY